MSVNDPTSPLSGSQNTGSETADYPPASPDPTSPMPSTGSSPGVSDPNSDATADFPPPASAPDATLDFPVDPREFTQGLAGDRTSGHEMTGDYTPGGAPSPQQAAPSPTAVPRVRNDRYALKRFHAKGGMGEVWLAEDCDVGREVALKRMRRKGSAQDQERFLREARITGQLEHPGIVPVHELGSDDNGQPIYVMKFVHGKTLGDAIKEYREGGTSSDVPREVQLLRLLEVFVALCQTVAYAHSRGVLHRDIKPDNVMLGPYGETLVLDWGLAKLVGQAEIEGGGRSVTLSMSDDSMMESVAGTIRGTPGYMAPEMAGGQVEEIDQLSDVYLLGATLYHILTGQQPRPRMPLPELIREATTKSPPAPRSLDPSIPRPLDAICMRAMAFAKADRYPSAAALAEDLQRYLAGEPVMAYPESFLTRAWRWAKKHRQAIGRAAIGIGIAGLVVAAAIIIHHVREEAAAEKLRLQQETEEAQRKQAEAEQQAAAETKLRQQKDEARDRLANFDRVGDEARFYLANVDPATEQAPYYDSHKGIAFGQEALAVADKLADLPLSDDDRKTVREQQYDLLLLLTQARTRESSPDAAREGLDLLTRAEGLRPASAGLHRLRAGCYAILKDERAKSETTLADDPKTPSTALDHFLLGEQLRAEAFRPSGSQEEFAAWKPNRELLAKALAEYRAALRQTSDHFWAYYQIGRCYLSLGQDAQAVEALTTCVALRGKSLWAYETRGFAQARLGHFAEADADFTEALKLDPDQPATRLKRGVVAWQQGGPEKEKQALADFADVLAAPPEKRLIDAAYYRGLIHLRHDRHAEALADFDLVAAQKPEFRAVQRLRANLHLRQNDGAKALDDLNGYLAAGRPFDPNTAAAREARGRLLLKLFDDLPPANQPTAQALALEEFRQAATLGARSATFFDDYGELLDKLGQPREAMEKYTDALKLEPKNAKVLTRRGWTRLSTGEPAQVPLAEADFAAAARQERTDNTARAINEAHTGLGYVLALRKEPAEAVREAHRATMYGAGDYGILHNVACIYSVLGRNDPARRVEYQNLAIDTLRRSLEWWKRDSKKGLNELKQIEDEDAFKDDLRTRKEFADLIKEYK